MDTNQDTEMMHNRDIKKIKLSLIKSFTNNVRRISTTTAKHNYEYSHDADAVVKYPKFG